MYRVTRKTVSPQRSLAATSFRQVRDRGRTTVLLRLLRGSSEASEVFAVGNTFPRSSW